MSFEKFLRPKSVAVVGASADPAKVGNNVLVNIIDGGYEGAIYPVNPKADVINGKSVTRLLVLSPERSIWR
jgi:acyl-CoA synthetase (NDP forming)